MVVVVCDHITSCLPWYWYCSASPGQSAFKSYLRVLICASSGSYTPLGSSVSASINWMLNESGGDPPACATTILSRKRPEPSINCRLTVSLGFFWWSDVAMAVYASMKLVPSPEYQNSTVPLAVVVAPGGAAGAPPHAANA